jgi:hypothetical protein
MRKLFLPILLLYFFNAEAQPVLYSSALIPDSLKKGADAVYLLDEMVVTLESASSMNTKEHVIATILTKNGLHHSNVHFSVDKLRKLDDVTVKVYNNLGIETARYKKKDFKLEGAFSENTLASDDKVYTLSMPVPELPCTVEYEASINSSGYLDLPEWYFGNSHESILKSTYIVKTNQTNQIFYKAYNTNIKPLVTTENNYTSYKWEVNNQPVLKNEIASPGDGAYIPRIDVSPLYFNYDGYPGTMKSWADFGMWRYPFYTETNPFTKEKVDFFNSLVKDAKNDKEKIAILYKYMQQQTRYVFIAYGIGGLKPFSVPFVEQKKYGDCKALSNYMKHILGAVGIKAYTASIYAGKNNIPFDPEFVTNRSNHIIVCAPLQKDTVWLECTSKSEEPGVLGPFTENRNALLITERGGILVNTPKSKPTGNQWHAKTDVILYDDGSAISASRVYVSGELWTPFHYAFTGSSKDQLKKILVDYLGFKVPDEFEVKSLGDSAQGHLVEIKMVFNQYYDFKTGSKHFFPIRHYKLNDEEIKPAEKRIYDYLFDFPYIKSDSTVYQLPGNFIKDALPAPQNISNDFVTYNNTVLFDEAAQKMNVISHLKLNRHIVEPAKYNDVARIFENIRKDENQKLVLKKQ